MKKIMAITALAIISLFGITGFMGEDKSALKITDVVLAADQAYFKIQQGPRYQQGKVRLITRITHSNEKQNEGSKIVELLQIPNNGIMFRIPLKRLLKAKKGYNVSLLIQTDIDGIPEQQIKWENLEITALSSEEFIKKQFKPIPELETMRPNFDSI